MRWSEASAISGSPGSWTAEVAEGWDIFGVSNGGYLMALATRAMEAESDGRALISATAHYLNPVSPGAVSIEVATLKQGRTMSTMRARMSRGDRQLLTVTSVFADAERSSFEKDLVDAVALFGEKTGEPVVRGWFRLRDDEEIDSHAVILATDAMPPAIFNSNLPVGWTPTVDLSVQVRNPAPRGWLACKFTTRFVTSGLLEEDGEIWDESGHPVALSRQLALVPR